MKLLLVLSIFSFVLINGHMLCSDTSGPQPAAGLTFCSSYVDNSCCATDDSIQTSYNAQINNFATQYPDCAAHMKEILCASCDPWSAHLFGVEEQNPRTVPYLCGDYCTSVYDACKDAPLDASNPFAVTSNTIAGTYASSEDFCKVFYGDNSGYCYSGSNFVPAPSNVTVSNDSLCIEKVNDKTYVAMAVPYDGSDRIYAVEQIGRILVLNRTTGAEIGTFLDLTDRVWLDGEKGLLNMVFHPNHLQNGLFYIYYSCTQAACPITCTTPADCNYGTCNSDGLCSHKLDPTKSINCINYFSEFQYNLSDSNQAIPSSERRLIRIEKSWSNHNGGWMSFNVDGLLYLSVGDGGSAGDPENNGQDMNVFQGKILRINVTASSEKPYTIPEDNPFINGNALPEIYAYGLRNPWRCSFDKMRPSYLVCADVGQDIMEEVDLIQKGGNYGWNRYEGTLTYNANTNATNALLPILEYDHTIGHSITGGYIYRGVADACHCGKYIFGDFQDTVYFSATETPANSGMFVKQAIKVTCSANSANCAFPGNIYSFGEDEVGEGGTGLYRSTSQSQCGSTCECDCLIDGKCLKNGDLNPDNECQKCDSQYPCQWTLSSCSTTTTSSSTSGSISTGNVGGSGTTGNVVNNEESGAGIVGVGYILMAVSVALFVM